MKSTAAAACSSSRNGKQSKAKRRAEKRHSFPPAQAGRLFHTDPSVRK
jgi:hypothetical protein